MDFQFTEEQNALSELSRQIFTGVVDDDRVATVETSDDRFDRELWSALADAGLLGVAVPEEYGGLGFGIIEAALVAVEQGRVIAPIPLYPTIVAGAMPLARFGDADQCRRWLPSVCDGSIVLSMCLAEYGANNPFRSSVVATHDGGQWRLTGSKPAVPAAAVADAFLVPAETESGLTVFVVERDTSGLTIELADTTNREQHGIMTFDDVPVADSAVVGAPGDGHEVVADTLDRVLIVHAAIALGCCERALDMAAAYTSEREQFGRPLSTNQGVVLRAASCYIDIECMRVTLWQAAWLLDEGRSSDDAIRVARYWATEAAQEVVHNTQHLHGGMGADVDYPVHRTFLWVKQFETMLGGGSRHLADLGASIAATAKAAIN